MPRGNRLLISFGIVAGLLIGGCDKTRPENTLLSLNITAPLSEQRLFTNRSVFIQATLEPLSSKNTLPPVDAVITVDGPDGRRILASGDIRNLSSLNAIGTVWNLSDVVPGSYKITVANKSPGDVQSKSVSVSVLAPPAVVIGIESQPGGQNQTIAHFNVSAKFPSKGNLDKIAWTFGDGSPISYVTTNNISHAYSPGRHTVAAEVFDSLGGRTLKIFSIVVARSGNLLVVPPTKCGCASMTIKRKEGKSGIYCGPKDVALDNIPKVFEPEEVITPPPSECEAGSIPYRIKLGPMDPAFPVKNPESPKNVLGWGFEVIAVFESSPEFVSDPALCTEGQYVRGGFKREGPAPLRGPAIEREPPSGTISVPRQAPKPAFTFTNIYDPKKMQRYPELPPAGTTPDPREYGGDNYSKPSHVKRYLSDSMRWIDQMRIPVYDAYEQKIQNSSIDMEFVQVVQGAAGSCFCVVRLTRTFEKPNKVGGLGLEKIDGEKCSVE